MAPWAFITFHASPLLKEVTQSRQACDIATIIDLPLNPSHVRQWIRRPSVTTLCRVSDMAKFTLAIATGAFLEIPTGENCFVGHHLSMRQWS